MLNYHKYKAAVIEEQLEIHQNILQLREPLTGWKGRLFYFVLSHHFRLSKNRLWSKTHQVGISLVGKVYQAFGTLYC